MMRNNIVEIRAYSYYMQQEVVCDLIDCFKMNKYQSVDENILYMSMQIYKLLDKSEHIDTLFDKYSKKQNTNLSVNLERLLYLALTFLYSIGMVETKGNLVRRV
jgi:hypothetical protein